MNFFLPLHAEINTSLYMTFNFKKILPDVYCIALFAAIAFAYFMSPVSKGYRLEQHDSGANGD